MKKFSLFFTGMFFLLLSLTSNAQVTADVQLTSNTQVTLNARAIADADFFVGTWSVLVKGLPDGDRKMNFLIEKKDATLTGSLQDSTGKEIAKLTSVEVKDRTATLYFTTNGYDVNLEMTKKDEDHVTGSMMGMFDAEGERVKAKK